MSLAFPMPVPVVAVALHALLVRPARRFSGSFPLLTFVSLMVAATLLSGGSGQAWQAAQLVTVAALLYLMHVRLRPADRLPFLYGIAGFTATSLALSLWQVYGLNMARAEGVFFHANILGAAAALTFVALVTGAASAPSTAARAVLWCGALASTGLLLLSGSRGALLGAVIGTAAVVLLRLLPRSRRSYGRALGHPIALLAIALLASTLVLLRPGLPIVTRFNALDGAADPSGRLLLWSVASEMIAERPILGYGNTGWVDHASGFEPYIRVDRTPHSHDLFLELALRGGLPALFCFLAFAVGRTVALARAGMDGDAAGLIGFGVMLCMLTNNVTDVLLLQFPIMTLWWGLVSLTPDGPGTLGPGLAPRGGHEPTG